MTSKLTVREANRRAAGPQPFNVGDMVEFTLDAGAAPARVEAVKVFGIDWFALCNGEWYAAPYVKICQDRLALTPRPGGAK